MKTMRACQICRSLLAGDSRGCGFQPQNHRLEAGATSIYRLQAGSYNPQGGLT
jgi:hypothetical protein